MSRSERAKKKMMKDVKRSQAIRRQQELKKRPFKSMIYQGKKAVAAAQKEAEADE